jgi:D-alanyl-D-alanine carboxypeptidase (penicillin-binding protein 5/6)
MRMRRILAVSGVVTGALVTGLAGPAGAQASQVTQGSQGAHGGRDARVLDVRRATGAQTGPGGIAAKYADLADAATGAPLWTREPYAEVPMGSIAKVMTAYVVLQTGADLDRVITVPKGITAYDEKYGASTAGLEPGEKLTTEQLLYAMLLPSGCDAAYTVANAYGPGISGFVAKMNAAAASLGLARTHFTDPSGLPDPSETSTYSDAQDLVNLGRDAMDLPLFRRIVGTGSYTVAAGDGRRAHTWVTTDPLLGSYTGAEGIKTGNTDTAGTCLLFEAERNGRTLIGVVLHSSPASFTPTAKDATTLLNWGFSQP